MIALFDDDEKDKIKRLQKVMDTEIGGLNDLPHLTLAVYDKPLQKSEPIEWISEYSK